MKVEELIILLAPYKDLDVLHEDVEYGLDELKVKIAKVINEPHLLMPDGSWSNAGESYYTDDDVERISKGVAAFDLKDLEEQFELIKDQFWSKDEFLKLHEQAHLQAVERLKRLSTAPYKVVMVG